jgi:hypothetical protein
MIEHEAAQRRTASKARRLKKADWAVGFLFIEESYGRIRGVGRGLGVGVALGVELGVAVGLTVGVGVAVGLGVGVGPDCAQYLPPVSNATAALPPPHTIISLPAQTAV